MIHARFLRLEQQMSDAQLALHVRKPVEDLVRVRTGERGPDAL